MPDWTHAPTYCLDSPGQYLSSRALGSHPENANHRIPRKREKVEEPLHQETRKSTSKSGPSHCM